MSDPNLMQLGQLKPLDERDVRQDRPPPSPYPGAASDGVQGILQQGMSNNAFLMPEMRLETKLIIIPASYFATRRGYAHPID
jgi:hypothetical protein